MSANRARVASFMRDLAEVSARVLVAELSLPADHAERIGLMISRAACAEHANEIIYVPSGHALDIDDRDRAMLAAYEANGGDVRAIAAQFGIDWSNAYKRIRKTRAAMRDAPTRAQSAETGQATG